MAILKDQLVSIHYTLRNDNGDIIDTSEGKPALDFVFGKGTVIKGLEKALADKNEGDSFNVSIPPEDAYGFQLMENIKTIPRSQFQDPDSIKIGTHFQLQSGAVAVVTSIDDSSVSLDLNHPLAGQTLHFDISVEKLGEPKNNSIDNKKPESEASCGCC